MASFSEQYLASLVANAAYVDFRGANPTPATALGGNTLKDLLKDERFSVKEAEDFARKFEVVAVYTDGLTTGFQGIALRERDLNGEPAGYGRSPGRIWIAFRGTEQSLTGTYPDLVADAQLTLGLAHDQLASLEEFMQKLAAPVAEGGYGLLGGGTRVNFAGHSLGGHLAQLATLKYPQYHDHTYTLNTANIGGILAGLAGLAGYTPSSFASLRDYVSNTFTDVGRFVMSSWATGQRLGRDDFAFSEAGDGIVNAVSQHGIVPLERALSVYRVFEAIGGVTQSDVTRILKAASLTPGASLEAIVNALGQLVPAAQAPTVPQDDFDPLQDAISKLFGTLAAAAPGTYSVIDLPAHTAELASLAAEDSARGMAVRYALREGLSFALVGASYAPWADELAPGGFSQEYLRARALMLEHQYAANEADRTLSGAPAIAVSDLGPGQYFAQVEPDGSRRIVLSNAAVYDDIAGARQFVFGSTGADALTGDDQGDFLFGRAGADTLSGGAGNDHLEGGADDDLLVSGAGVDTLDGGTGSDTYRVSAGNVTSTIYDADGNGAIELELPGGAGTLTLGASLQAVPGAAGVAVDSAGNRFRLALDRLAITTPDGRTIVVPHFGNGDLGLTLPAFRPATPAAAPSGARVAILPDVGNANPYSSPINLGGPWGVIGEESAGVYTTETAYSEVIDASALTPTRAYWELRGGFGDSYLKGVDSTANLIIDDYYFGGGGAPTQIGDDVGDDQIAGGAAANFIETHGGNDRVFGGGISDVIVDRPEAPGQFGTVGWVNAAGNSNEDDLYGGGGNDYLLANAGDGHLDGGDGADLLFGGAGGDLLLGGSGNDVLSGDTRQSGIVFAGVLTGIELTLGNIGNDTTNFGADTLVGDAGDDHLIGGGGNDVLYGGADDDRLDGDFVGAPSGTWVYDTGSATRNFSVAGLFAQHGVDPSSIHGVDTLHGEAGNDELIGGGKGDFLHGGDGSDILYGDAPSTLTAIPVADQGNDVLYGDEGDDFLYGNGGDDYLEGGSGNDQMAGDLPGDAAQTGSDELHGGDGADLLRGQGGPDRLYGDAGNDQLAGDEGDDVVEGGEGDDVLQGNDGRDRLDGGPGVDSLDGGAGDDELHGSAGGDALFGGAGDDTFVLGAGSGSTQIVDDEGVTVLRFGQGIGAGAIQVDVGRNSADGSQLVFVDYGGGDRVFMPSTTFATIDRFEFADGISLSRLDLTRSFVPPTTGLGDRAVHSRVSASELTLVGVNDDLLIRYAGPVPDWVDTSDLAAKGVFHSLRPAADYDLGAGQVLVLHNWYLSGAGQYLNTIADPGFPAGGAVDLYSAAYDRGRRFVNPGAPNVALGSVGHDTFVGSASPDVFAGGDGNDTFDPGAGNDFAAGQLGNDVYVVAPGSGADVFQEEGGVDSIDFQGGLRSTDVVFHDTASGLEAIIGNETDGNRIVVTGWFDGSARQIESWAFSGDAVTLNVADVEARIVGNRRPALAAALQDQSASSGEPFTFTVPAGSFVDPNAGDVLRYRAALTDESPLPAWLSFDPATRTFSGTPPGAASGVLGIRVRATDQGDLTRSDTFTLSFAPVLIQGTAGNDDLNGTARSERLEGLAGNDNLRGQGGDDVLVGGAGSDLLSGNAGNDTYLFGRGDDSDSIYSSSEAVGDTDVLHFGPGILPGDLRFSSTTDGDAVIRLLDGAGQPTADAVRLREFLPATYLDRRLSRITFEDAPGTEITAAQIDALAMAPTSAADYVRGSSGGDSLVGLGGDDRLLGLGGDDVLYGGPGNDRLEGGAGSDTYRFERGDGADDVTGTRDGAGGSVDSVLFGPGILPGDVIVRRTTSNTPDDLTLTILDPSTGAASGSIAITDGLNTVYGHEILDQVQFADLPGTVWDRTALYARSLMGLATDDRLIGYPTDDVLRGNGGGDYLDGAGGNDDIAGGTGNDQLVGGAGDDTYRFGHAQGTDEIHDVAGNNRIVLDAGISAADVTLYRSSSIDPNTKYPLPNTSDGLVLVLNGGAGQLWIDNYFGAQLPPPVSRIEFADGTIWASSAIDARVVNVSGTANAAQGTAGDDAFTVDHRSDTITEAAGAGTDSVTSSVTFTLPNNVENLTLTGLLNLNGTGNALNNALTGNAGTNWLDGMAGVDTLAGGAGDDSYVVDTLGSSSFDGGGWTNFQDIVDEAPGSGYDTIFANDVYSATLPANVEQLIVNGMHSRTASYSLNMDVRRKFTGNPLDNTIDASNAQYAGFGVGQTFSGTGAGGEIVIDGGAGADLMIGPANNLKTSFIVDHAGDVVIVKGTRVDDRVQATLSYVAAAGVDIVELLGSTPISATGNSAANRLDGSMNAASNALAGGTGDDTYVPGSGDVVQENAGEGIDTVQSAATYVLGANLENLTLTGTAAINGYGNALDNVLTGNDSSNILGVDGGRDRLVGGGGNDWYGYGPGGGFSATSGADTILDTSGSDRLQLNLSAIQTIEQLQFARLGDDLRIAFDADNYVQVEGWYASAGNVVENVRVVNGALEFNYSGAQLQGRADGVNTAPVLQHNSWFASEALQPIEYQFPLDTFADIESQNSLAYTARLAGGAPLPAWMAFDPVTRTFSGVPPAAAVGAHDLEVTATDAGGLTVTAVFTMAINSPIIRGTAGNDVLTGDAADNNMDGLAGDDSLMGLGGDDYLCGSDGNDLLDGGVGADELEGGPGDDTYVTDDVADLLWEIAGAGTDTVRSSLSYTLQADFENLVLLGSSAMNGTGNSLDNLLTGNGGSNSLTGLAGNDTLDPGSSGTDVLIGGAGDDTYVVDRGSGITITENAGQGTDLVRASVSHTLGSNLENLTLTGTGAINGTGNSLANVIRGNGAGNTLSGGTGADTMIGGAGNDTYVVDNSADVVTEVAGEGTDLISSSVTISALAANVENLTLTGSSALTGTGNALDNVLTGNGGSNTLTGLAGNDTLNPGSAGTDSLVGGLGDDTYVVGRTRGITITESAGQGTDLVQASVSYTLGSNLENLNLTGSSAINGTGNSAANVLIGNGAGNTLSGLAGGDRLRGGAGSDILRGGDGADRYEYAAGDGADTIDNSSADSATDRLAFTDLARTQISFSRTGNDLLMRRISVSTDSVRVTNWFTVTGNQIDFVETAGGAVTSAAEINALIAGGGSVFPNGAPLQPVVSSWAMSDALLRNRLEGATAGELGAQPLPDLPIMDGITDDFALRVPGGSGVATRRAVGIGLSSPRLDRAVASL